MAPKPFFADLHTVPEDERIRLIGETVTKGNTVAVLLERNEPEKVARYLTKLANRYPEAMLVDRVNGPTETVVTLKFGPRH